MLHEDGMAARGIPAGTLPSVLTATPLIELGDLSLTE